MKLLAWIKPRTATLEELADQLERAREAHTACCTATAAAERAFDDEGSASAERALLGARDAERSALEHRSRAERLHAAALEAKAAAEREATERRAAELEVRIADRAEDERLAAAEVAAWLRVVDARMARRDHEVARSKLRHLLMQAHVALGRTPRSSMLEDNDPPTHPIFEALQAAANGTSDPRGRFTHSLAHLVRDAR